MDASLQHAYEDMERLVEQLTAELQAANERLERENAERVQAEEALRESKEWNRLLLGSISDGCWVLDKEWRYRLVNEAGARLVNMSPGQLLGQKLTTLFPGIEDTEFFAAYERAMEEQSLQVVTGPFTHPDRGKG
ncbi:MAG: PAS domain-containing protein, partial [Anaerolineae bacterium]